MQKVNVLIFKKRVITLIHMTLAAISNNNKDCITGKELSVANVKHSKVQNAMCSLTYSCVTHTGCADKQKLEREIENIKSGFCMFVVDLFFIFEQFLLMLL